MFTDGFGGGLDAASVLVKALPIVSSIALIIFVVLGLVLAYHWRKYSYNAGAAFLFQVLYWSVGGFLVASMGTAVAAFIS